VTTVIVPQTVGALRAQVREALATVCADPATESLDLLAALHDAPRHWAVQHDADVALPLLVDCVEDAVARRTRGAPLQYAVQRAAFRHLYLHVDPRVLIPRPETEELVALALARVSRGALAIDIGTGSGAIALSLATEGRFERVIATDLSSDALQVATLNARAVLQPQHARVSLRAGSLLAPCTGERADLIVANPPYIREDEGPALPSGVRDWEPAMALFGGDDGMRVIQPMVEAAPAVLTPGGWLCLETDTRRVAETAALCDDDAVGRPRFVTARRAGGPAVGAAVSG
jgi:release factor glutamine methyltransferase